MSTDLYVPRESLDPHLPMLRSLATDRGTLELIVVRPSEGERETPETAEVTVEDGLVGDRWEPYVEKDGTLGREAQLTIASTHLLGLIAEPERWALAGDQLYVDLDLSGANLPPGTRLRIGGAVIEVTPIPHTGCAKFVSRFGAEAMKFVNSPVGRELNLRGICAKVVEPGAIRAGDRITKI